MAIFHSDTFDNNDAIKQHVFGHVADVRDCFLCGEPLSYPMIAWHGTQGLICFHGSCAKSFALRLGRDCWELEKHERGQQ